MISIGCGRGVAAALICDRLEGGRLLALDRSAKAMKQPRHGTIRRLLLPEGSLWLFYDPPGRERLLALETTLTGHLEQAGYRCRTTTRETARSTLLGVAAEPLRPPTNLHTNSPG